MTHLKLIAYVGRSKGGRWPASAFVNAARQVAKREKLSGALLDDGLGIFHVVEGDGQAVDRFMAFVLLSGQLRDTRIVYEAGRMDRLFGGHALAYCSDESWRPCIATLVAGAPFEQQAVWRACLGLQDRMAQFS